MKQRMISLLLAAAVLLNLVCIPVSASDSGQGVVPADDVAAEIIYNSDELVSLLSIDSLTDRPYEHHGNHSIIKNDQVIGSVSDNVYGVYSQADKYAIISSVNCSLSFTIDISNYQYILYHNGVSDWATVYINVNSTDTMKIAYKLHSNGYLEENITYY